MNHTADDRKKTAVRRTLALTALAGALVTGVVTAAQAEPLPDAPGTYPATNGSGTTSTATDFITALGADADAELFDSIAKAYNAQAVATDAKILSFDAVNPQTGTVEASPIHVKPGCDIVRPNGANAGLTAILKNQVSSAATSNPNPGDGASYCIDVVRSSRSKKTDGTEAGLTFYDLTRDAVTWATIGGSYAPDAPLTTKQVRGIYEGTITNWAQVGGQYGAIHVYAPPTSAATYTFFLQSIGSSVANMQNSLADVRPTQQNDGTQIGGDPQGITPYAVTKWAAQLNHPSGINDLRGGTVLGRVPLSDGSSVAPVVLYKGGPYYVLNPQFASGTATATSTQGRVLYNTVRNGAPDALKNLFTTAGYVCTNEDTLLPPFGAVPLGLDTGQTEYCGKPN